MLAGYIMFPVQGVKKTLFPVFAVIAIVFSVLGIILFLLTVKQGIERKLKVFLVLSAVSSAVFVPAVILHNLVYGLFIKLFGENYWAGKGDEALFFIIAVIICPVVFLTGLTGSIIFLNRRKGN